MKDRRKYKRYYRNLPVKIDWDETIIDGRLVDLSMTGAGCWVSKRIPLYAEVVIHFIPEDPYAGEEMFSCTGTVVRCCKVNGEKDYQLGLFFTHLSEEILSQIMDLAYY